MFSLTFDKKNKIKIKHRIRNQEKVITIFHSFGY